MSTLCAAVAAITVPKLATGPPLKLDVLEDAEIDVVLLVVVLLLAVSDPVLPLADVLELPLGAPASLIPVLRSASRPLHPEQTVSPPKATKEERSAPHRGRRCKDAIFQKYDRGPQHPSRTKSPSADPMTNRR
jgi:hypothetical protein